MSAGMRTLLVRADGGPETGFGHVMRCLALAEEWRRRGGEVAFVQARTTDALADRVRASGFAVREIHATPGSREDADLTAEAVRSLEAEWCAIDGAVFGSEYQRAVREAARLLVIDDDASKGPYHADLVLNQNVHARSLHYTSRGAEPRLLLGERYVLLRDEFLTAAPHVVRTVATNVMVTMGGSDAADNTSRVLRAIRSLDDLRVTAVVGAAYAHLDSLREEERVWEGRLAVEVDTRDMPRLMANADVAVSSGGTSVWELLHLGVPSVVGTTVPVEELLVAGIRGRGVIVEAGAYASTSPAVLCKMVDRLIADRDERERMSAAGRELIDGLGRARVADAMNGSGE